MPMRALARERMMRSVMAARLPRTEVRVAGRRTAAVAGRVMVCVVVGVEWDGVDLVAADFVDAVLEERFGLRPFALVLKGLAMGARLMDVSIAASGEVASEVVLPEIARRSSAVASRWNSIYWTPIGFAALLGWVEVWELDAWEMTGAGSFG
jgi:hypothetical protein